MAKSLLYKLFKFGKLPEAVWVNLEEEGIILADEGIRCAIHLDNFRGPGRLRFWRRKKITATLVVTGKRFAAFGFFNPIINIPLDDERMDKLDISVLDEQTLSVSFDPGDFLEGAAGGAEFRFATSMARDFYEALRDRYALFTVDDNDEQDLDTD